MSVRNPIKLAASLLHDDTDLGKDAATTIRDLHELAKAQSQLLVCYRLGKQPPDKVLDTISRLRYLIEN